MDPRIFADRLAAEDDISIRRALVLGLGQYRSQREPFYRTVTQQLRDEYTSTDDPGLRAAIEYAFRQWGRERELESDERAGLAAPIPKHPSRWFHTHLGQTMIVIAGPTEFLMGSACTGHKWTTFPAYHTRQIPRSYAIGATEVTVEQFHAFLQDVPSYYHFYTKRYSPNRRVPRVRSPGTTLSPSAAG